MPKRSNEFQRLIRRIYEQMANSDLGETVTESAMLVEASTGQEREVDVLLEGKIFDRMMRIAIECRDYSRKQNVTWIDELIGKYKDLAVDTVYAVSSSGFTNSAYKKALSTKIKLLSLEQALDTDWPSKFQRFGLLTFGLSSDVRPVEIFVKTHPVQIREVRLDSIILDADKNPVCTLIEYGQRMFEFNSDKLFKCIHKEFLGDKLLANFPTKADLKEKSVLAQITHQPDFGAFIEDGESGCQEISEIGLTLSVGFIVNEVPLEHYVVSDALVTKGRTHENLPSEVDFTIVQSSAKPNQAKVWWDRNSQINVSNENSD